MPAAQRNEWNARLRPSGPERGEDAARDERVAPMLKMTDAFSYARDCWEILTFVKASLLFGCVSRQVAIFTPGNLDRDCSTHQGNGTLSSGTRSSSSSSCPKYL